MLPPGVKVVSASIDRGHVARISAGQPVPPTMLFVFEIA